MLEVHLTGEDLLNESANLPSNDIYGNIHVKLTTNGTFKIPSSFWNSIFTDERLYCLSLIDLQLYQNDGLILADYLKTQNNLIELTLDSVRISTHSLDHIIKNGLQRNRSIEHLTLSNLGEVDASTIASLIEHNNTIKYLRLTHDEISSAGGTLIATALQVNKTLITLDLSYNKIDQDTAYRLINILQEPHPSLTDINLNDNYQDNILPVPIPSETPVEPPETEPILPAQTETTSKVPQQKGILRILPTILVTFLFFLWGIPNNLNGILINQFSKAFTLSHFEAGLVQFAFYLGYFAWSLPAAYVLRRWGYKVGIILGLFLFGTGSFLFWPAALIGQYTPFLISLFIIATGLAFLETAANPFIANAAGPIESSEKRLNIAQAFNPLGAITGALIGTLFIFSGIELSEKEVNQMQNKNEYDDYLKQERLRVIKPYVALGAITYLWLLLIIIVPFPTDKKTNKIKKSESSGKNSLCQISFLFSVFAQFTYVGAQVGTWSYFIQYAKTYVGVTEKVSGYLLMATLAMFALGRFIAALLMHLGFSSSILLATFALINVLLIVITVLVPTIIGFGALLITSFFMSLMFPTIFALGIKGLSEHTSKLAGSILIMSIIGGSIFTPLMGLISEKTEQLALAFVLPGGAYLIIGIFALLTYVLPSNRRKPDDTNRT